MKPPWKQLGKRPLARTVVIAVCASVWAVSASAAPDARNEEQQKKFERYCSSAKAPNGERFAERLSSRLDLREAQKPALNDLRDTFAKSMADAKATLCGMKPDFATTPGRLAFARKKAETTVDRMKALEPKVTAFYSALDDKQKASLEELQLWSPTKRNARQDDAKKGETKKSGDSDDE